MLDLWNDVVVEVRGERDGGWNRAGTSARAACCAGRAARSCSSSAGAPTGRQQLLLERLDLQADWLRAYDPNLCERPITGSAMFHHFWVEARTVPLRVGLGAGDHSITLRYVLADAERAAMALDGMPGLQPLRRHLRIHAPAGATRPRARSRGSRSSTTSSASRGCPPPVPGAARRGGGAARGGLQPRRGTGRGPGRHRPAGRERGPPDSGGSGRALRQALVAAVQGWLEEPSPWLRGRRPLDCAGHEVLGGRVMDRLKELDNAQLKRAGRGLPSAELDWAWERLGIGGGDDKA
ncbi:MAG: antitoxin Xre/MbcA/ParS toxin-binding domain-containing protein [Planctomycetota bacterium]